MLEGGCHCGAIRYRVQDNPIYHALCHCTDCRRATGAPAVSWALFRNENFEVLQGEAKAYASSENARRHYCAACGTSLFYTNEIVFPNMTDIQSATLDDPGALPLQIHVQTAERVAWMRGIDALPQFDRYPGP
ncbi:MAG TPA: GFA family protein [Allosphingosinicella sp.]|nr:GFA family protein [Allosphingosinicella sp.]